ncbi:hypothetical protein BaOVIS_024780 [Babesia ovis]|uniref:Uncharacterized protein n=1 Tax=Babesia ovis TaxID=5869 RepID=A0A9W5TET4_BABOV|nr:hypothetical protein BaOVIS_024780 [Babesia ovis]
MRRRVAKVATSQISRYGDLSYGKFTGTEFYMSAVDVNTTDGVGSGVGLSTLALGRKSRHLAIERRRNQMYTIHYSNQCFERPSSGIQRHSAVDAAIALRSVLKGKKISHKAKEYWRSWILAELDDVQPGKMVQLVGAMIDLRLANGDLIHKCIAKAERINGDSLNKTDLIQSDINNTTEHINVDSLNKTDLIHILLMLLKIPNIRDLVPTDDLQRCVSILRSCLPYAPEDTYLHMVSIYASMVGTGLVGADELGTMLPNIIDRHKIIRTEMTLGDTDSVASLMKATRTYIIARGDGWNNDPLGSQIVTYINKIVIPEVELNVLVFTASQLTEVLSLLAEANIGQGTNMLQACSERFVRDVSQFSVTTMLEFHVALLRLGHRDPQAILTLIITLPRRAQSLDSVDHILALLEIMQLGGIDSEYMRRFVSEQLLQLGYKIGKRHCDLFSKLFYRRDPEKHKLLDESVLDTFSDMGSKHGINFLP